MIQLADARRIIAAAEKKADEIGQPMNIAVVDAGGNLIAHVRMDNAWLGSIDISIKKAWTSRAFDIATKDLATHSQSGDQFFGIHASNDGKVMIFAGGIPLKKDGKVVGAIGVSGGSGEQDHAVAEAGAAPSKFLQIIRKNPKRVARHSATLFLRASKERERVSNRKRTSNRKAAMRLQ